MHRISAAYTAQTHSRTSCNSARPCDPRTSAFVTRLPMSGLKFLSFGWRGLGASVGGQDSMKTRQVQARRRHQRDQPPHQGLGRQSEGDSFLGRVLVAAIVECTDVSACNEKPCATATRRRR